MAETPDQNYDDLGPQQAAQSSVFIEIKSAIESCQLTCINAGDIFGLIKDNESL